MKLTEGQEKIAKLILDYLRKHPDSADTLRGIAEYWVGFAQVDGSVEEVEHVLGSLVEDGNLVSTERSGIRYYRLCSGV